jgi:formiminotetrahydrofolate cyclodeaminase
LDTGIRGGYYNVCINLKSVKDEDYVSTITAQVEDLLQASAANLEKVLDIAKDRK